MKPPGTRGLPNGGRKPKSPEDVAEFARLGGAQGVALKKRLEAGALSESDRALVEQAKTIRELRRRGKSFAKIAAEMGENTKKVYGFATRGCYAVITEWLDKIDAGDLPAGAKVEKAEHRGALARLIPKAIRRLGLALDSGEVGGVLVESKAADHAMDTVLEAAGLLEPEGGAIRPVVHIDTLVIQNLTHDIRLDDARTARTIDVTPQHATG